MEDATHHKLTEEQQELGISSVTTWPIDKGVRIVMGMFKAEAHVSFIVPSNDTVQASILYVARALVGSHCEKPAPKATVESSDER